jgi:hypothetical protein
MLRIQGCVSKKPAFAQEAVFPLTKKTSISQGFHPERVMEIETAPPCRELLREDQYFTD